MAGSPGKNQVLKLDDGASLVDISDQLVECSISTSLGTGEDTAFGDNSVSRVVTLADGSMSMTGSYAKTAAKGWDILWQGFTDLRAGTYASLSFEYSPEGTTGGDPKVNGELIITSLETTGAVGDLVTFSCELVATGDITYGTN